MELHIHLTQAMVCEEMMKQADYCIGTLPRVRRLINEVVYLPRDTLAAHTKNPTFSGGLEIHGPGLEGIVRVVDLLGKVKGVMDSSRTTTSGDCGAKRR